jgi:hypothetical protein
MKKFINSLCAVILIVTFSATGCFLSSGDDENKTPASPVGNGTLEVKATYNGSVQDISKPGTKKIYVYVFSTLDTAQSTRVYEASTDAAATLSVEYTITISSMAAGSYYVLAFYDYKQHNDNVAGKDDRYILYNNTPYSANASTVAISDGNTTTLNGISFGDSYSFGDKGSFMSMTIPAGTLEITATYTGVTGGSGTGNIYACVFSSLGSTAQSPLYQGSTSALAPGVITISNIPTGNYYVVLFYDYADNGGDIAGEGDPYAIYNSAQYIEEADQVAIGENTTAQISQSFSESNTLALNGAYKVNPGSGTLEVKATYNGTAKEATASGKIYVYLYSSLANAQTTPLYSASTDSEAVVGDEYTLTVSDVAAGSYYVLVFYDYRLHASNVAGRYDRYELYNNTGSMSGASQVVITDSTTTSLAGISFDNTWQFGSDGAYLP